MATRRLPTPDTVELGADEWRAPIGPTGEGLTIAEATENSEELAIGERIRLLLSQTPVENITLRLSRIEPKNGALAYCCVYSVEEWENGGQDMVRNNWGPGKYELMVVGTKGTLARPRFTIAQPFAMMNPAQPQQPAQQNQSSGELAQVMQSMAQMFMQSQQQILEAIRATNTKPEPDPMAELHRYKLMKEIFAPAPIAPATQTPISEIIASVRALKDLSGEINPAPAIDTENPMSMIPALLDTIRTFAANKNQPAQAMQPMQIPASIAASEPPPQVQQPTQPNPAEMILKGATQKIVELATANADPKEGGQFIHDSLPDELLPYLNYPNWFDILASFAPELKPHQEWITKAKAHADTLFAASSGG